MVLLCRWHSELSRWRKKSHRMFFSPFSPPTYIREHVCAQNIRVSWGDTSVKPFGVSSLWTISHCPFLQQERSSQGRVPEREWGSTCLSMGLLLTCDMPLDRQVCSFFFPCHVQSFILILDPQGGDSSSLWLLSLETACTMLVLLTAASVSQEELETLHAAAFSAFHRAEHKAAHGMEMCVMEGQIWARINHRESTILLLHQGINLSGREPCEQKQLLRVPLAMG